MVSRNSPASYSKLLEASIRIQMRGPVLQNSIKTPIPAHLWPFKVEENCDALDSSTTTWAVAFFRVMVMLPASEIKLQASITM
jgi:hypothetical protein